MARGDSDGGGAVCACGVGEWGGWGYFEGLGKDKKCLTTGVGFSTVVYTSLH